MPSLDRARIKHNDLVAQLAKTQARENKYLDLAFRARGAKDKLVRAIARSSKRIDKLVAAGTHNRATAATMSPDLTKAVVDKKPAHALNDPVPTFGKGKRRRRTPDDLRAELDARNAT